MIMGFIEEFNFKGYCTLFSFPLVKSFHFISDIHSNQEICALEANFNKNYSYYYDSNHNQVHI